MKQDEAKKLLTKPLSVNQIKEIKQQWHEIFKPSDYLNPIPVRDMLMDIAYND
jgi:hypothetical protein